MQYIHKSILGPSDLRKRKHQFFKLLKDNDLLSTNDSNKIYGFYNKNKKEYELDYRTYLTKKSLLKAGKNRCCFCGCVIHEASDYDKKRNFKIFTIEHFKTKALNPLYVLDWGNLFPACSDCNKERGEKKTDCLHNPSSLYFYNSVKHLIYSPNGEIISQESSLDSYINVYDLNSKDLKNQRKRFYKQIVNPNFELLLKIERVKKDPVKEQIIFIDEFENIMRQHKYNKKNNESSLLTI